MRKLLWIGSPFFSSSLAQFGWDVVVHNFEEPYFYTWPDMVRLNNGVPPDVVVVADKSRPPFVLVVDVGTVIEVYAEFSRTGGTYTPFPDPRSHRIALADLAKPEVLERLRRIWTQPDSLNPARISAQVTRDVAQLLARLAKSLESSLQDKSEEKNPLGHASQALTAPDFGATCLC